MTDPLYDSRNPNHNRIGGLVETSPHPISQATELAEELRRKHANWALGQKGPQILLDAAATIERLSASLSVTSQPRAFEWRLKGSNDEWVPCAVPGDPWQTTYEYRALYAGDPALQSQLNEALTAIDILRTENQALLKTLEGVRGSVVEECAEIAERDTCKMKCASPDCLTAKRIAGEIRALQSPAPNTAPTAAPTIQSLGT